MRKLFSNRTVLFGSVAGVAAALAIGLVVASQVGSDDGGSTTMPTATSTRAPATTTPTVQVDGTGEVLALLRGLPQNGNTLGNPKAPVTLVEYADMQCPFCAEWAHQVAPTLINEYVRPGKVKLVFRGIAFIGPDSLTALQTAIAAGLQDRLWHVVELLFRNQGDENTGWVTTGLLERIGASVPGLDTEAMLAARDSEKVVRTLGEFQSLADAAGINSTPSFEVGKTGGTLQRLQINSLTPEAFRPALDALLGT